VSIRDAVQALGIEVRVGLHTGECEVRGEDIGGIAVHIGARVSALAGPNDVLVSSTLRDLVIGSGLEFDDRGTHELKGVPGESPDRRLPHPAASVCAWVGILVMDLGGPLSQQFGHRRHPLRDHHRLLALRIGDRHHQLGRRQVVEHTFEDTRWVRQTPSRSRDLRLNVDIDVGDARCELCGSDQNRHRVRRRIRPRSPTGRCTAVP
jgi:hypothetical protein